MSEQNLSASQKAGLDFLSAVAREQADFIGDIVNVVNQTTQLVTATVQTFVAVTGVVGGAHASPGSLSSGAAGKGASLGDLLRARGS